MIAAFRGWNDGAQGASLAASFLTRTWGATKFADIDPEEFYDFQAVRPQVTLEDGETRRVEWPENAFYHAAIPDSGRDVIILMGVEPSTRWRTFTSTIIDLVTSLGAEMVLTLGALLADVPHTRPAPVTGTASDSDLVEELELTASKYQGPTGIVGVLHDACREANLSSASLWAAVPHYASLAPSPKAAYALCERLAEFLAIEIDLTELDQAAKSYEDQVTTAVAGDEETSTYVKELEKAADSVEDDEELPSGDSLAADFTRFLREHEARRQDEESNPDSPS